MLAAGAAQKIEDCQADERILPILPCLGNEPGHLVKRPEVKASGLGPVAEVVGIGLA